DGKFHACVQGAGGAGVAYVNTAACAVAHHRTAFAQAQGELVRVASDGEEAADHQDGQESCPEYHQFQPDQDVAHDPGGHRQEQGDPGGPADPAQRGGVASKRCTEPRHRLRDGADGSGFAQFLDGAGGTHAPVAPRCAGGLTSETIRCSTVAASAPSNSASASSTRRWASTGSMRALTSSGIT